MSTLTTCAQPGCGKQFEGRKGKVYCSSTCRSKASIMRTLSGIVDNEKPEAAGNTNNEQQTNKTDQHRSPIKITGTISPIEAQLLLKEADRWESAYKEKKASLKKAKEQIENLRHELAEIKSEQKLKSIEDEYKKPSGLDGILESPLGQQLMPHIGPVLGRLLERAVDAGTAPGVAGTDGGQPLGVLIAQYIASLPEDVQDNFRIAFEYMAGRTHEEVRMMANNIKQMTTYYASE